MSMGRALERGWCYAVGLLCVGVLCSGALGAEKLDVAVSILPHKHFVERIGGERVQVFTLIGKGQSPHSYSPTAREIIQLSQAKVFFRTGVGFERGVLPRIERMFPEMEIVDLRDGLKLRAMGPHTCDHSCGHDHAHDHGEANGGHQDEQEHEADGMDPHVWLSPQNAQIQARTICEQLCKLDPPRAAEYRRNLDKFVDELEQLDKEIAAVLKPLKGEEVFVFHPAFGYFLDAYGLTQVAVEIDGKDPTPRQLGQLIERAARAKCHVIFVQPQFSKRSAAAIAEAINGAVVPMNPLAEDYVANLRDMARKIEAGVKRSKPQE